MSWENIENTAPAKNASDPVPAAGVRVTPRVLGGKGGRKIPWISFSIGAELAKGLSLVQQEVRVRVMKGSGGGDLGKVAISVDATMGPFTAKRAKDGSYKISMNAASAAGKFALTFPAFSINRVEAVRGDGRPPMCAFPVSPEMLAVPE